MPFLSSAVHIWLTGQNGQETKGTRNVYTLQSAELVMWLVQLGGLEPKENL